MRKRHPNWDAPVQARLLELPADGDAQTAATISLMREFARADATTPPLRALAAQAPAPLRQACEHIFWTVRRAVRFKRDTELVQGIEGWSPDTVEVLVRPVDLLSMRPPEGDCDDFSMLVASLLTARGIPSSFATVAADPLEPTRYSHVYCVAHLPDGDFALDASHGSVPGWECPNEFGKRRLWGVGKNDMSGLGDTVPVYSTTVTGQMPADVPWWQQLVNRGLDIVQSRYGLPENTYVVTQGGVTSRGSSTTTPAVPVTDVRGTAAVSGISANTLMFGGVALLLLLAVVFMSRGGGGRR